MARQVGCAAAELICRQRSPGEGSGGWWFRRGGTAQTRGSVVRHAAPFDPACYVTKRDDRKRRHAPLLLLGERLIERLPCVGELLQVGCPLLQVLGASLH